MTPRQALSSHLCQLLHGRILKHQACILPGSSLGGGRGENMGCGGGGEQLVPPVPNTFALEMTSRGRERPESKAGAGDDSAQECVPR